MRFILKEVVDVVVKDDEKASRTTFLQGWCLIGLLPFTAANSSLSSHSTRSLV